MAIVHLLHGLLGTGKTTYAKKLESTVGGVCLGHDEWVVGLYGRNPPAEQFQLEKHMLIRAEEQTDWTAVHGVNVSAFETPAEANLVNTLRKQAQPVVSLVAEENKTIVGHIMFSPVTLVGHSGLRIMGLGPMAVVPSHQRKGIGSALVRAGLGLCKQLGSGAVVVLGHPGYYPRFGFLPSRSFGIGCEYEVPDEAFMVAELQPGFLHGASGTIKYHPAFSNV